MVKYVVASDYPWSFTPFRIKRRVFKKGKDNEGDLKDSSL